MMEEESSNPTTLAESAERMKNMTPEDMATLIGEMENMDPAQKAQLKAMGMDPDTMLISMKMMKDNPAMMATAQKLSKSLKVLIVLSLRSKTHNTFRSSVQYDPRRNDEAIERSSTENVFYEQGRARGCGRGGKEANGEYQSRHG
jgi:hypothetical protein